MNTAPETIDPSHELPPPPEEKLLSPPKRKINWRMVVLAIIAVALMEMVAFYLLNTEADIQFIQSFFNDQKLVPPTEPTPTP